MSIPTRGIEKHLACRLPGLPPRMSVSDEGKKNDALYGYMQEAIHTVTTQLQRVCSTDPWWQEQNQYLSSPYFLNTRQHLYWSNLCWTGHNIWDSMSTDLAGSLGLINLDKTATDPTTQVICRITYRARSTLSVNQDFCFTAVNYFPLSILPLPCWTGGLIKGQWLIVGETN